MDEQKRKRPDILLRFPVGRLFLAFWLATVSAFLVRIAFDLKTYYWGSTLIVQGRTCRYMVRLPAGSVGRGESRPLLVYLHGAGELRKGVSCLKRSDPGYFACGLSGEEFPFIVVCPKNNRGAWKPGRVVRFLEEIQEPRHTRWRVDPDRIYLTGYSMGGYGVWETAMRYPDYFAAIVPLAGGCRYPFQECSACPPVWAFHGELDAVVPPENSIDMIGHSRFLHPDHDAARLTLYPEAGHDIAARVYQNPGLYRWILSHKRHNSNDP